LGLFGFIPKLGVFGERVQLIETQYGLIVVKDASSTVPTTV
jgi:hypothetical protein